MKTWNTLLLLMPMALIAVACDDDDDSLDYMQNQEFVSRAASSNTFEIEAGELAVEQGTDDRVVEYGEHMVVDHGAAGAELEALAMAKDWNVPDGLMEREQEMLDELRMLEGAAFDQLFAQMMVQSHEEAVELFERASGPQGVADNELREWAAEKLPTLRAHLEDAQMLNDQINP